MKFADSNRSDKSLSPPTRGELGELAQDTAAALSQMGEKLKADVVAAAQTGVAFDSIERTVFRSVLEMGRQAMELFVSLQGDGDLGGEIQPQSGKPLKRSDKPSTSRIRSIFGVHLFDQFTYASGKHKAIALRPISARMSLPEKQWSFLLEEFSQMLCVDSAYEQAMQNLGRILGQEFSIDTAEQINQRMGMEAGSFLEQLPLPQPDSEAKLLVASADCKGVPLVKEDYEKVAAFEASKKRPGNRRMATVASVYTVDPHVRTAEDVTAALFRDDPDEDSVKPKRPRPKNKNTTAHFPTTEDDGMGGTVAISGIHVAMAWIIGQVILRRQLGQVLIVLMDGQESLWETLKLHLSFGARTVPVLDILHVLVYIWEAAGLFEKDDKARRAFTRERLLRILRGEVHGVIRGLRRLGTTNNLAGKAKKDLHRICGYLENNADRMHYDECLRRGYPIASGVIEGACRHLVKDRMERSGMRWTLEGARSMLNVRAAFQSDHWNAFLEDRTQHQVARIHCHRDLLSDYKPLTIAC
jgi:hypothetical protein